MRSIYFVILTFIFSTQSSAFIVFPLQQKFRCERSCVPIQYCKTSRKATVQLEAVPSSLITNSNNSNEIWYTDPDLKRADLPSKSSDCRYIITTLDEGKVCHLHAYYPDEQNQEKQIIKPVFLEGDQVEAILENGIFHDLCENFELTVDGKKQISMIWLGNHKKAEVEDVNIEQGRNCVEYWAICSDSDLNIINSEELKRAAESNLGPGRLSLDFLPLREFGDQIIDYQDAAIHSMANGLIEFHKSHKFCSACGSPTILQKAGSSRQCSNSKRRGGTCTAPSIYPRIDVASIMLITSFCQNYALLGRKSSWPSGRYSTLAGFLEIGETIEECCARETLEESGVTVDKDSIQFVRSQPWPFPRSLMVGFRARAEDTIHDGDGEEPNLPEIDFDVIEMEDVKWFHRDFVAKNLHGGSTAINYVPTNEEREFHIPGKASLANHLITSWAMEK